MSGPQIALSLVDWLREREANARRIAETKGVPDAAGWLVDADYFCRAAQAALAQQAQPEAEPSGWLITNKSHCTGITNDKEVAEAHAAEGNAVPLYTAPPEVEPELSSLRIALRGLADVAADMDALAQRIKALAALQGAQK